MQSQVEQTQMEQPQLEQTQVEQSHHEVSTIEELTRVLPKKKAPRAKPKKVEVVEYQEEIYSNEPTPIYGKDRLLVMQKIQSYCI